MESKKQRNPYGSKPPIKLSIRDIILDNSSIKEEFILNGWTVNRTISIEAAVI
jgi:hypothetical protein